MKRLAALTTVFLLAVAPAAEAKGTAQICGGAGCTTLSDPGIVGPLRSTFDSAPAPEPAPFYLVRFCGGADGTNCRGPSEWSYLYVPSAKAMLADDIGSGPVRWMHASLLSSLLAGLTKGLDPYPASPTWALTASPRDETPPTIWLAVTAALAALVFTMLRRGGPTRLGIPWRGPAR